MTAAIYTEQEKRQNLESYILYINTASIVSTTSSTFIPAHWKVIAQSTSTPWDPDAQAWTIIPESTSTLWVNEQWAKTVVGASTSTPFIPMSEDANGIVTIAHWTPRPADASNSTEYQEWVTARDAVTTTSVAIVQRMESDQLNAQKYVRDQSVLDGIGNVSSTYSSLTDPVHKELYASTVKPDVLDAAQKLSSRTTNASVSTPTSLNQTGV